MARKTTQSTDSGVWVLLVVALVAVGGLWWVFNQPAPAPAVVPVEMPAPAQAPVIDDASLAKMQQCQESYEWRAELCNRRTHKASVQTCLAQTEELLEDCLVRI